jgi:hypothetical protein
VTLNLSAWIVRCGAVGALLLLAGCGLGRADDRTNKILVGGDINHEAVHAFERANGHHPSRDDLLSVHRVWIDNEVLYREGLKLPLEPGEAANRESVISKSLASIEAGVTPSTKSCGVGSKATARNTTGRRASTSKTPRYPGPTPKPRCEPAWSS